MGANLADHCYSAPKPRGIARLHVRCKQIKACAEHRTPNRIARAYVDLTAGLRSDPRVYLKTVFHVRYNQIVLLRNIPFHSICEHHFLPFVGHAHVAYLPRNQVVGLSKLARVVEAFALRPQVQERLTDEVADAIRRAGTRS